MAYLGKDTLVGYYGSGLVVSKPPLAKERQFLAKNLTQELMGAMLLAD